MKIEWRRLMACPGQWVSRNCPFFDEEKECFLEAFERTCPDGQYQSVVGDMNSDHLFDLLFKAERSGNHLLREWVDNVYCYLGFESDGYMDDPR